METNAKDGQARIEVEQVGIHNYEKFVNQLEEELPMGTSFEVVKEYLTKNRINFSFSPHENCLRSLRKKIYSELLIFKTDLQIKFCFDEDLKLKEIKSKLFRTAF